MKAVTDKLRPYFLPAAVASCSLIVALLGENATALVQYDRGAIEHGQWWRLLSGHFAHLGFSHLMLNIAGLALISALFSAGMSPRQWTACFLISAAAVSTGLYFFQPQLHWYVGLSGVLHGLFVSGAIDSWRRGLRLEGVLLLALVGKLIWEQLSGPLPGSEAAAGGPVVVDAHMYGAIGGLLFSVILLALQKTRRASN